LLKGGVVEKMLRTTALDPSLNLAPNLKLGIPTWGACTFRATLNPKPKPWLHAINESVCSFD